MSFKKYSPLLFFALFIQLNDALAQSGWAQEKGALYSQISGSFFSSDKYYGVNGASNPLATEFRQQALNLYAEYGLTPQFTAILNTSALRLNSFSTTNTVAGPGDLQIGLKYALPTKVPIAISVLPEIPLGKKDNFAVAELTNDLGFKEKINLATTDGELNVWSSLAISTPFPKGKGWASAFSSYNLRSKGFSDQLQIGIEVGLKPSESFYLKTRFTSLSSLGKPKENVPFFRGEGTEYTAASLGAGWDFGPRFGLIAEYWRSLNFMTDPKNVYLGPVFTFGLTYQIKKGE